MDNNFIEWEKALKKIPIKKRRWMIVKYRKISEERSNLPLGRITEKVKMLNNDDKNKSENIIYMVEEVR